MIKYLVILLSGLFTSVLIASPVHAGVNDFYISNYDIRYELSRDESQRSVLKTQETITPVFSDLNSNHGIERSIPTTYDGHSISLKINSVTDKDGRALAHTTYEENGNKVLRIGNKNKYVHGPQTYVITYTQRDVTRAFKDTASDEFYWDTNGTDWRVPINNLNISLAVKGNLAEKLNGKTSCYKGAQGSDTECNLTPMKGSFIAEPIGLKRGENTTIAIGFNPSTFAAYEKPLMEKLFMAWIGLQVLLFIATIGLITWLSIRYYQWADRTKEHDPIVPEYLPPKEASVQVVNALMPSAYGFTAQIIDFAVRHYIQIIQTKQKKGIFSKDEYEIKVIRSIDDLRSEEIEILTDIFTTKPAIGSRLNLKDMQKDTKLYGRTQDNPAKLKKLIRGEYGLREKNIIQSGWYKKVATISLVLSVLLLSPSLLVMAIIAYVLNITLRPVTDKGLALLRYAKGLKIYISVAETERLKMLQSPEGAAKVQVDGSDTNQLVKLYERVLPYAILFGQEKQWNKQLGQYYESSNTQPTWYSGSNGAIFNAAAFSSAMNSFTSTANYSSPASSSSGGSSGGGSSGGGGGGGGGGGW